MKRISILALLLLTAGFSVAQDITGDWQGTLYFDDAEQRLVLHIMKNSDGTLRAMLDSVDLGRNGLAVTQLDLEGYRLTFAVDDIDASFRGKVMGDGKTILGKWQQGRPIAIEFNRAAEPILSERKPGKPSDIDGTWTGALQFGGKSLRVVFKITNMQDGLMATLGAPDQSAQMFPATAVTREGASLKIEAKQFGGVFAGKIATDHSSIDGTWTQGENALPLVLKPLKDPSEIAPKAKAGAP